MHNPITGFTDYPISPLHERRVNVKECKAIKLIEDEKPIAINPEPVIVKIKKYKRLLDIDLESVIIKIRCNLIINGPPAFPSRKNGEARPLD